MSQPSFFRSLPARSALCACVLASGAFAWSITGTVKSGGVALSGVTITVQDSAKYSTTTDAQGQFSLQTSVGVLDSRVGDRVSAKLVGDELLVSSPKDGPIGLSLVDVAGRTLWSAQVAAVQGEARASLPVGVRHSALFLRLKHADGVEIQSLSARAEALHGPSYASRAMATYPVLLFKKDKYNDTTYAMTTETVSGITVTMSATNTTTCPFPTTFKWKDNGAAIASPKNGWTSIKDFTNVLYNGKHYIYMSYYASGYKSAAMAPFTDWSEAANASQTAMSTNTVAPELMYFTPKKQWILSYQWCSAKFCYMTSSDPANAKGWTGASALLSEDITGAQYGPIDQVPICDATNCYLFYAADNGKIYRASMPIGNFPGKFSGSKQILSDTQANLFEAVEVYTVKGQKLYLMIVECMGSARYFRAFTATSLDGDWKAVSSGENTPFAGRKNITNPPSWTNDISHGDLVRTHDETRTIDPCNLQLIYQGYAPSFSGAYDLKPYKLGLLTFVK